MVVFVPVYNSFSLSLAFLRVSLLGDDEWPVAEKSFQYVIEELSEVQ